MSTREYRPDVDGLRAIAVLSVVLYHAGLPWLPGGYVGVDVFFVISGYLIIGQIGKALSQGSFSFADFWSRRALRILPPYLLVIGASMAIAPFVLVLPEEYAQFSQEVVWSAFMVVNHLFLSQQGYFDTGADSKVLLHLWSLAVEEQFYIFAPLAMFLFWRLTRGTASFLAICLVTALVFAASLAACIAYTAGSGDQNFAFFLMPLRVWEFAAGGAVALLAPAARRLPRIALESIGLASLVLLVFCIATFTHQTPFPSYWALLPVLGAVGMILTGTVHPRAFLSRVLALPPMVWIGLVSYSWYLWHWPLLALSRIYNFDKKIMEIDLTMVVVSLVLAVATRYAVELPILRWRQRTSLTLGWRPTFAGFGIAGATALIAALVFQNAGRDIEVAAAGEDRTPHVFCDLRQGFDPKCASKRPLGIMIGDSHARSSLQSLTRLAAANGSQLIGATSAGCISLVSARLFTVKTKIGNDCSKRQEVFRAVLADGSISPEYAILYSRWPIYMRGKDYRIGPLEATKAPKNQKSAFAEEFQKTFDLLKASGVKRILVIASPPTFPRAVKRCIARSDHYGIDRDRRCSARVDSFRATHERMLNWLEASVLREPAARLIDPAQLFCDARYCRPYLNDKVLISDTNHPTDAGVEALIAYFRADFDWLLGHATNQSVSVVKTSKKGQTTRP